MTGLRDAPLSVAGEAMAEPGALALLQNTLRLNETLLVTGAGDAWQQILHSSCSVTIIGLEFHTDYAGTVAVLLC